jgi:hypothetical protein
MWLKEIDMSAAFFLCIHSIIASRGFSSTHMQPEESTNPAQSQRTQIAKEKKHFRNLRLMNVSHIQICYMKNKYSLNTCYEQNTLLVYEIKLNLLYIRIRDHPTYCVLLIFKFIIFQSKPSFGTIIDGSFQLGPQLNRARKPKDSVQGLHQL